MLRECAEAFGRQCVVLAIDAKRHGDRWEVYTHGGTRVTGTDAVAWAEMGAGLGAGEILLTSMDRDGTKTGYDLELLEAVRAAVDVPIIASGGAGKLGHLTEALDQGRADAVLAASIFHRGEHSVQAVKQALAADGIPVRHTSRSPVLR
jgi:cyclase